MGSLKELGRLLNGLSLIAKEFVISSQALEAAKNGDLPHLIKKAIVSATDLSVPTKGNVRRLSDPSSSNPDSVVHFSTTTANDSSSSSEESVAFQQQQHPSSSNDDNDTLTNIAEAASSSSSTYAAESLDTREAFGSVKEGEPQDLEEKLERQSSSGIEEEEAEGEASSFDPIFQSAWVFWPWSGACMGNCSGLCQEACLWFATITRQAICGLSIPL